MASFFLGIAIAKFAGIKEGFAQGAFAIASGFAISTFLTLAISWLAGDLAWISICISISLLLIPIFILKKQGFLPGPFEFGADNIAALAIFLILFLLNITSVLAYQQDGRIATPEATYVDYPFHLSIITNFAYGDNFPPTYPIFARSPLTYPFIMDFLSAIFIVGGLGLREAVILGNLLFSFALVFAFVALARKISGSKTAAAFAIILLLLNGNFGIIYALQDAFSSGDLGKFITVPAKSYAHMPQMELHFMSILTFIFIAERGGLMGFAIALFYYSLFFEILNSKLRADEERRKMALAGLLLASLVMIYPHAFLAAAIISALSVLPSLLNEPKKTIGKWLPLIGIATLLSVPQLLWVFRNIGAGFVGFQYGWMDSNKDASLADLASFWLKNIWVAGILAIIALWKYPEHRKWFAPFGALFIIANLIKFQPQDWDTIKIHLHWFMAICILGGIYLAKLWGKSRASKAIVTVILIAATGSAALNLLWYVNDKPTIYEAREIQVASWIRDNTPEDAVFMTGGAHNHLVSNLAGRHVVMGFGGHLWTQGIRTEKYGIKGEDIGKFYRNGDCNLGRKLGADYVFVSEKERELKPADFDAIDGFERVYSGKFGNSEYKIYRLAC